MRIAFLQDQQVRYSPPQPVASAAVTGTATSGWTEAIVTTATRTIIITLTNTTWVASGATFNAQRQAILDGVIAAQSESNGWNAKRPTIPVTAVVRTSATVVTVTVPVIATYVVTADETLTVTVPGPAVVANTAITATPHLTIGDSVAAVATQLVVTTQPAGAVTGVAFTTQPVVRLQDAFAANVLEAGVTVTAYLSSGSGTLGGTKQVVTNASGIATFTNLSITGSGSHTVSFHALMSQVQTIWSDDVEVDRSSSYFEKDTAGGRFGRAVDPQNGNLAWKSTYQSGTQVSHGNLHLAFGRTPDPSYMVPVYGASLDFGEVTAEFDVRCTIANPWTDKCYRCHVFAASDFSQAAQMHAWAETTTQLHLDPASGTNAAGQVITSGYNDFANLTFLGAVAGTAAPFGATATTRKRIKVVTRLDDPGQANGFMKQYIDDVLDAQKLNLALVKTYTGYGINAAYFENFTNVPQVQTYDRYFDNISVTGRARAVVAGNSLSVSAGGGTNPNQPSGYTQITSQPFDSIPSGGWYFDSGSGSIITDGTAPTSPSNVLRASYPTGFGAGNAPFNCEYSVGAGKSALYYNLTFKPSSNFYGNSSSTNKLGFVWTSGGPDFFLSMEGSGSGTLTATARYQGGVDSREYFTPNVGPSGAISRGAWHTWESQLVMNTGGAANGIIRCWLDGVKIIEYTDVRWTTGSPTIPYVSVFPIWGGTSGTVPSTQTIDFDHYYASAP